MEFVYKYPAWCLKMDVVFLSLLVPSFVLILSGYIYMQCTGRLQSSFRFPATVAELYALYLIVFHLCWGYVSVYAVIHALPRWVLSAFVILFVTHFSFIPLYISAHKQEQLTTAIKLKEGLQAVGYWLLFVGILVGSEGVEGRLASSCAGILLINIIFNVYWLGVHEFEDSAYFSLP